MCAREILPCTKWLRTRCSRALGERLCLRLGRSFRLCAFLLPFSHSTVNSVSLSLPPPLLSSQVLSTWKHQPPASVGAEALRQGMPPQTKQDMEMLESLITSEIPSWNLVTVTPVNAAPTDGGGAEAGNGGAGARASSSESAAHPGAALWQLACDEVARGTRCSAAAAEVVARFLGVPAEMPPEPAPQTPFVPPTVLPGAPTHTPQHLQNLQLQALHAYAGEVAAATVPTLAIQPRVYLELVRIAVRNLAVMDVIHSCGLLDSVMFGFVFRLDILGGYIPPPERPDTMLHDLYGELFLVACQLVNRYKMHQSLAFLYKLDQNSARWSKWALRGCFRLWLRRHTEILRFGKLNMEDRSVENDLIAACFNQNWGKIEPLENATRKYCPWAVLECVPSFAERVFQGACMERMEARAAAAALHMLVSVVRYAMVDVIAHISVWITSLRMEGAGKSEAISQKQAISVLHKLLEDIDSKNVGQATSAITFIDRNLAFVLHQFPDGNLTQRLKATLDLAPIDMQSYRKVVYDVLVGVHRGGPQLRFSQDIRQLCDRCGAYELSLGMLTEVMALASQGNSSPSYATMFNLASIGSFLLFHSARLPGEKADGKSNHIAESYMKLVLPGALSRIETQRQALLLARFNTMLAIFNGCSPWRAQVGHWGLCWQGGSALADACAYVCLCDCVCVCVFGRKCLIPSHLSSRSCSSAASLRSLARSHRARWPSKRATGPSRICWSAWLRPVAGLRRARERQKERLGQRQGRGRAATESRMMLRC